MANSFKYGHRKRPCNCLKIGKRRLHAPGHFWAVGPHTQVCQLYNWSLVSVCVGNHHHQVCTCAVPQHSCNIPECIITLNQVPGERKTQIQLSNDPTPYFSSSPILRFPQSWPVEVFTGAPWLKASSNMNISSQRTCSHFFSRHLPNRS